MKVLNYQAHNVLRVKDVNFDLKGHHLFLVGGENDQGKTSALKALLMALCGRSGMRDWPEVTLREGEDRGWVKVDLGGDEGEEDFSVHLELSRRVNGTVVDNVKLVGKSGSPRSTLASLFHYKGFDPLEFDRLSPDEQARVLMDLCGLDFTQDEAEYKSVYSQRTDANREVKRLAMKVNGREVDTDLPSTPVDVASLVSKLDSIRSHNAQRQKVAADISDLEDSIRRNHQEVTDEHAEIEALKNEIAKREMRIAERREGALAMCDEADALRARLAATQELSETETRNEIAGAGDMNDRIAKNNELKSLVSEHERQSAEAELLSRKLDEIKDRQAAKLKAAKWPVKGLGIQSGMVMFNGLPWGQCSKSVRTIASTKIGMALNPKLRLLVCQDGGDLDVHALDSLEKLLEENDFQMILELVTRSKADEDMCAVVIEGGETRKAVTP